MTFRKIIHIDMDSFYASVEQRDFPHLKGKAIAVGGSPDGRGVVATASYEARKFGVKSAMSSHKALQLCPDIIFVKPRFEIYKEVSVAIRDIFHRYTDLIEPLSLDEAYLDVTLDKLGIGSAIEIAKQIKLAIKEELNLTASAGVSINKFTAKIASDYHKPDGLTFIGPSKVVPFLASLPIEKFFGVGKVTAKRMKSFGIHYGRDLKMHSKDQLIHLFGKSGGFFYEMVRGNDNRPVNPNRISKSVGAEDTFEQDISDRMLLNVELQKLCEKVSDRLKAKNRSGRTLTLKVKFEDFIVITRSVSFLTYTQDAQQLWLESLTLLEKVDFNQKAVRLLGVSVSNLDDQEKSTNSKENQLRLF